MKLWGLSLLLLASFAAAQTSTLYTTTANCGGAKDMGYASCPAEDINDNPVTLVFDNRAASTGFTIFKGTAYSQINGPAYVFPHPTDHTPFTGTITYSASGYDLNNNFLSVNATLNFSARWVSACSGRGCGGTLGWHYTVLQGSQATVTQ
jgi:hypothetical protein